MDRINIKNLEVFAWHGVAAEENVLGQMFVISAALYMDLRKAGNSDDLDNSIDYCRVCREITGFVGGNTFSLIETVAEKLAEKLLIDNRGLKRIWLEIKKPQAPIGAHLETVSVEIERGWHTAYIALGSNMGDREAHLRFAVNELEKMSCNRELRVSGFLETKPYGYTEQNDFLNGCAGFETLLEPLELLDVLHDIESRAGRERRERWGPRTLDLDMIFYDDLVMSGETLRIPHAGMHRREFVLAPLCEIASHVMHPVMHKTVEELLFALRSDKKDGG